MNPLDLFPGLEQLQMFALLMGALDVARASITEIAQHIFSDNGFITTVQIVFVLYVILYGVMLMNGAIKDNLHDFLIRVFKLGFVIWFITTSVDYIGYAVLYVWTLPEELVSLVLPVNIVTRITEFAALGLGPAPTTIKIDLAAGLVAATMSSVVSIMTSMLEAAEAAGGGLNSLHLAATGMAAVGAALSAVTLGTLIVAKVSLAILLAVGPLFIPTILFEKTKHLFEGWLAQIINYVLLLLLMSIAIYILFPVLLVIIATFYALSKLIGLTVPDSMQLIALLGIFVAIMRQVPSTAASISRGYAVAGPDSSSGNLAGGSGQNPGQTARQAGQG